jgi:predicted amidohydrolase YtcJ
VRVFVAKAITPGGSDAPIERGEPMIEFYAAVARKSVKGFSGEGWHPEQALSREQALKMFTAWPAYAAFEERDKGSIEAGKLADLTVLSKDIMKIPEPDILTTTVRDDGNRRRSCLRKKTIASLTGTVQHAPAPNQSWAHDSSLKK